MVQAPVVPIISVRRAVLNDLKYAEAATKVVNGAYRSEGGWTTEKDIVTGQRCTEDDMKKFITENGKPNTLLFAFDEDEIVGTVQIQPNLEECHTNEAEVGLFSVSPLQQSRGIGGKLIKAAMSEMKTLGFKYATMHVLENRPEILTWYRKLGFVETGERIPFIWPDMLIVKGLHFLTLKKPVV